MDLLTGTRTDTSLGLRRFSVTGPWVWDRLPCELCQCNMFPCFKSHLKAATDKLVEKIIKHNSWPIQPDILNPPLLRLTSRKPLWLDLQPVDIKSRWRHNWKLAQVVNSHLVRDPTIWQPGFYLPQQQWSLLNRFLMEQGHCGACRRKLRLTDTDLTSCGETQTMSHIVESYTLGMKTLFRSWPVLVRDMHTRRRVASLKMWLFFSLLTTSSATWTTSTLSSSHVFNCILGWSLRALNKFW